MELLDNIIVFSIFLVLQSLFINGVKYCFEKDNLFYNINPIFFERHKDKWWAKPLWRCIRCMASVYGTITFWPAVLYAFGFNVIEIPLFLFDIAILIPINWIIYKKTS
jgi:hypothetical protein